MTEQQVKNLNLGIAPIDQRVILIIESGLEWVLHNTILKFDINNDEDIKALPSSVRLFLVKFFDVQMLGTGVSSESIEGLSQSFDTSDKNAMIWQFAEELLGAYLKSPIRFVAAKRQWR
jgi:hypothetical protein